MAVLVTYKFDADMIQNVGPIVFTTFLHYMSMGNISSLKGK